MLSSVETKFFYCVPEARKKLFSGVSDTALIYWINFSSFHIKPVMMKSGFWKNSSLVNQGLPH